MRVKRNRITRVVRRVPVVALAAAAIAGAFLVPAHADGPDGTFATNGAQGIATDTLDARSGEVAPTTGQQARVTQLAATARWTRFGTVATLSPNRPGAPLAANLTGSPEAVARAFVDTNRMLFKQTSASVDQLEVVTDAGLPGAAKPAHVVVLRERFGGIPAGAGGLITVGVAGDRVEYASSSAYGAAGAPVKPTLTTITAWRAAARNVGRQLPSNAIRPLHRPSKPTDWATFTVAGIAQVQQARLVAVGVPDEGVRPAYETNVVDVQNGAALAVTSFVDAVTGGVLVRHNRVDAVTGHPRTAPVDQPGSCEATVVGCGVRLDTTTNTVWSAISGAGSLLAGAQPVDTDLESLGGSQGANAITREAWGSPLTMPGSRQQATPKSETGFADVWRKSGCDVANLVPGGNDIDAAVSEVFSQHNRLHDWTYALGFTHRTANLQRSGQAKGDPEVGYVQSGALTGGYPTYLGRNNANQVTLQDGFPGLTNLYLFQPVAAKWYGPCVDSAFDPTVVAHEYAHAVAERMAAGPDLGLTSPEANTLSESWADLLAAEYLSEHGESGRDGAKPTAIGAYVGGNAQRGIRNYAVGSSPLNFGNLGYDVAGSDPAADGEIWSAANWDARRLLGAKYEASFPVSSGDLQRSCANGERAVTQCPGNRRWLQLVFDSLLLQQSDTTMLAARDAMLAADRLRFGGANQAELWQAFAGRGLGAAAALTPSGRPRVDFTSPLGREGTLLVTAVEVSTGRPVPAAIRVGRHQVGTAPVTTTDPRAGVPRHVHFVPGTYDITWSAPGYGMGRTKTTVVAGRTSWLTLHLSRNLASSTNGATVSARGSAPGRLIDDAETSAWSVRGLSPDAQGVAATVDLAGVLPQTVRSVRVSALPGPDGDRFTSLRQFALESCTASPLESCAGPSDTSDTSDSSDGGWRRFYTSPADAFPAGRPRPVTPDLTFREFDVPDVRATHLRLVVLSTQCTGAPAYVGEQDTDPLSPSDCRATTAVRNATVAELMAYGKDTATRRPSTQFELWD